MARSSDPISRATAAACINIALWSAFVVASVLVFVISSTGSAMDMVPTWLVIGAIDAVLAGTLLWRHGVSLAMPVVIAVYFLANWWLLFYLFLSAVFWPTPAP